MKVPVLVTYIRALRERGSSLSSGDRDDATRAIEQSDNEAINAVFGRLKELDGGLTAASRNIEVLLRLAEDTATHVNTLPNNRGFSTFGQTEWSTSGSVRFYRALARGCLMGSEDTSYILGLMRAITPSERWGVGQAGYPSRIKLAFKGGWGPELNGSYLVRQSAIVGSGTNGYVLSLIASPNVGGAESFATGQRMLTEAATWARRTFALGAQQSSIGCQG
jgi:hypothetical protein